MLTKNSVYERCLVHMGAVLGIHHSGISSDPYLHGMCSNVSQFVEDSKSFSLMDLERDGPVGLAKPLMGYVAPVVIFIMLTLNTVLVVVLSKKHLRSPTNVILIAIAVCDTLTGLLPLPEYVYKYIYDGYRHYPSMHWCVAITYMCRFMPQVLHTMSLWLNALLAFHRYIGVRQLVCKRWICRYSGVIVTIVVIGFFSFLSHCFSLLVVVKPVTVIGKDIFSPDGIQVSNTCYTALIVIHDVDYFSYVYTCVRLTFAQLLPCMILLVFNVCLIKVTYNIYDYRRRLIVGHRLSELTDSRRTIRLSVMLLLITSCTWIFETLVNTILILNIVETYTHRGFMGTDTFGELLVLSNFLIILSFPFNFIFFFILSNKFRKALHACIKFKVKKVSPQRNTNGHAHHIQRHI